MILTTFKLAFNSLRFRKLSISLTIFSLAVSIMLFLAVDIIRVQTKDNFINSVSDIDLIVGARSGSIQLLLYSIFHIGNATNNISWNTYQKISKHPRISWSIPIALGDSHKGFRVVGTQNNFFKHYKYQKDRKLQFRSGEAFTAPFEATIGANVAKKLNYDLGKEIILAHGMGNVNLVEHENTPFKISGILTPTGSALDDSVFISLSDLELMHLGWEHGVPNLQSQPDADQLENLTMQPKSITAFLLKLKSKHDVFGIQRAINDYKKEPLLAILPGVTLLELWKTVSVIEKVLLLISMLVIGTALLSMLAIILSNLNSRRHEIAVLRSLGATPLSISLLMIIETELLIIISAILAFLLMYLCISVIGPYMHNQIGIMIELTPPSSFQLLLIVAVLTAGLLVSLIPAIRAYRNTLQDGLIVRS